MKYILISSFLTALFLILIIEGYDAIRSYFRFQKNRHPIDFNTFLKSYTIESNSWEIYNHYLVFRLNYLFNRESVEYYIKRKDRSKFKKWKKEKDKQERKTAFLKSMEIIRSQNNNQVSVDHRERNQDYIKYVDSVLNTEEKEPFCPFGSKEFGYGYCDRAYSGSCYNCPESEEGYFLSIDEIENERGIIL